MMFSVFTVVFFGFFFVRGFPKKKTAYRLLLGLLAILSFAATIDSYIGYTLGYYFPDQPAWPFLVLSALSLIFFAAFLGELVFLTRFRARAKKEEPHQPPVPTP